MLKSGGFLSAVDDTKEEQQERGGGGEEKSKDLQKFSHTQRLPWVSTQFMLLCLVPVNTHTKVLSLCWQLYLTQLDGGDSQRPDVHLPVVLALVHG